MTPTNKDIFPDIATSPILHAAIYYRVSTEDQYEEGFSAPEQLDACLVYAKRYGFHVSEAHIFHDEVTGTTLHRPGLDALRDVAEAGLVQVVIVPRMDRFGRKHVEQVIVWQEFKSHGVQLLTVSTPPGEPSPERDVLFNILSSFSEYEHAVMKDRSEKGRRGRARAGYPRKQKVPIGYRYVPVERAAEEIRGKLKVASRGYYVIEEYEAGIIRQMYVWYGYEGWTLYRITRELNLTGVPTPVQMRGYKKRANATDLWTVGTVDYLLHSHVYLGTQPYGRYTYAESLIPHKRGKRRETPRDTWIGVEVPPIIDADLWQAVQRQFTRNLANSPRNQKRPYPLGHGRIVCAKCLRKMGGTARGQSDGYEKRYYRCNVPQTGGVKVMCRRSLDAAAVETDVWLSLEERFKDAAIAKAILLGDTTQPDKSKSFTLQRQRLEKEARQALRHLERLEAAYYAGGESPQEYAAKKAKFREEHERATTQLAALSAQETQARYTREERATLEEILEGLALLVQQADTPEKREDFVILVDARVLYQENGDLEVTVRPWDPPAPAVSISSRLTRQSRCNITLTWICAA